jgi:tetratricopeptide (TPR) repeat protein
MWVWTALTATLVTVLLLREMWVFGILPGAAQAARSHGNLRAAIRILERVLRSPSLFGDYLRTDPRFRLAWFYLENQQPEQAIEMCRQCLKRRLRPALESNIRRRLADCLEAAGRPEEAAQERKHAAERLQDSPHDTGFYVSLGQSLVAERRYSEAVEAYEQALAHLSSERISPVKRPVASLERGRLLLRLALALWESGHPDAALARAKEALANTDDLSTCMVAHSVAALACSDRGDLEEAERHYEQSFGCAVRLRNVDKAASYLATLGSIQRRRGILVKAVETCQKAAEMSLQARRAARLAEFECMLYWGKFEDARQMLDQAARAYPFPTPSDERRSQAVIQLGRSWLEAETGHPEKALECLREAEESLGKEEKLGLACLTTEAWILACLGRREESRQKLEEAQEQAQRFPDSRATQASCCCLLGRAAYAQGDDALCLDLWERFLQLRPDPVDIPRAHYYIGLCRARREEIEAARAAFQAAIDTELQTYHTQKAEERLANLSEKT